ncbi:unnamed protein product, partial [Rotaria socialis]
MQGSAAITNTIELTVDPNMNESNDDQITLLTSLGIVTDDNNYTGRRIEIKSTVEINTLYRNPVVLDSQSQASLPDTVLCCECGHMVWKPFSAKNAAPMV